jgi:hypothetical protein
VPTNPDRGCDVADTWDEAACRARLTAVASKDATESSCLSFSAHALSDLRAVLAALDAARAECDRLRAAADPVVPALAELCRVRGGRGVVITSSRPDSYTCRILDGATVAGPCAEGTGATLAEAIRRAAAALGGHP